MYRIFTINARGEFFPCSFTEGTIGWETGLKIQDFESVIDIWNHVRTNQFRGKLLSLGRNCPIYEV